MKGQAATAGRTRFTGWPKSALVFFQGLKRDNSKTYFDAHRSVYERDIREPMETLLAELERDLGPGGETKIFRLNRDLRFTPDKRPYKEQLGAYVTSAGATGFYVQLSADGVYAAIGAHEMAADQLGRYREAVAGKPGEKLASTVTALRKAGFSVTEPALKRVPSGYPADHARAELLRCTGLMASRSWRPGPWLHTAEAGQRIRAAIKDSKSLYSWLETNVGRSTLPARPMR